MRIAMIGTRGVPARYGGFETAVEEVGRRLTANGHEVTVYCRNPDQRLTSYQGMRLVNLPALRERHLETLSHTLLSVTHAVVRGRPHAAVVFNAANAPLLPVLRRAGVPFAVHVDGLEWKRGKWAGFGARYYRWAERRSVALADALIADARGIADHIRDAHGRESIYIPYGAPLVAPGAERLAALGLARQRYHLVVARFAPENHVTEIVEGFVASAARYPMVVVGSAPYEDEYTAQVRDRGPRRRAGTVPRQHLGPAPAGPALRQHAVLRARALGRRHQPLVAARDGCRRAGHRLRRGVQPRGRQRPCAVLDHPERAGPGHHG